MTDDNAQVVEIITEGGQSMNLTEEELKKLVALLQKACYIMDFGWWSDNGTDLTGTKTHVRICFDITDDMGNLHGETDAFELRNLLLKVCGFPNALEKAKAFDKEVRANDDEGVNIPACVPLEWQEKAKQILKEEGKK